ncbi:MAG: aspartyl-phosphate phosphatase Spo0E family protein [Clostridium sp.]|uniref:aspartyl-phosphate phosphatase Spo0E family protein n=1 Tax=Clostridium sp. TaxID=1506 RepID=UPI002A865F17|nr:aspartyl-phosphate phosphatase Spo0E family protein [Clostridium sp.]MDY5098413.1 aspartyl-phosphate phosphatase Spo0E family protein [Clostridium sp.]
MNRDELQINIEELRHELYTLLGKKNPTDQRVVECSKELDKLIVIYQKNCIKNTTYA